MMRWILILLGLVALSSSAAAQSIPMTAPGGLGEYCFGGSECYVRFTSAPAKQAWPVLMDHAWVEICFDSHETSTADSTGRGQIYFAAGYTVADSALATQAAYIFTSDGECMQFRGPRYVVLQSTVAPIGGVMQFRIFGSRAPYWF